jgi:UDPglucose 6-dehydrogenase
MVNICVIGTGYVGLISAVCFAKVGHKVICVDTDQEKVNKVNSKIPPIYEKDLQDYLNYAVDSGNLKATTDLYNSVKNSDATFIAVGTPCRDDGHIDLQYVNSVVDGIGPALRDRQGYHVIVMKSTVSPGTTESIIPRIEQLSGKKCGNDFGVCMNPEFLKEGLAIEDFMKPDRVVIGQSDKKAGDLIEEVYKPFNSVIDRTSCLSAAEMIKYTSNSLLATKISFANEIGDICKRLNIDVYEVMKGVGLDHRLGPYFLNAGPGFGGSCFPKDVSALISQADSIGFNAKLLKMVLEVNHDQPYRVVDLAKKKGLRDRIAVLGLAFKPGTDDIRFTPAKPIIEEFLKAGKQVYAYDPQAMDNMRKIFPNITYTNSAREAVNNAEMVIIVTHWYEFRDYSLYKGKVVIDARDIVKDKSGMDYEGLCW